MIKGTVVLAFIALAGNATSARCQAAPAQPPVDTAWARLETWKPLYPGAPIVLTHSKTGTAGTTRTICPIPTIRSDSTRVAPMPKAQVDSLRLAPMPIAAPGCVPDSTNTRR